MILYNDDYVEQDCDGAKARNQMMLERDKSHWFYRKWAGLEEIDEKKEEKKLENLLAEYLKYMKDLYRISYEKGIILYPTAVPFADYKEKMESGQEQDPVYATLLEVFRRLPKGGLLHVHSAAALSAEGLIALLGEWNDPPIFIETAGISAGKMDYVMPADQTGSKMALQIFLAYVGAENRLKEWLTVGAHTDHVPYIWDAFNQIFMRTSDLFENRNFYYEYHRRFFLECLRDRIDYVELRCGFQNFADAESDVQHDVIGDVSPEFLDVLIKAKEAAMKEYDMRGGPNNWDMPDGDLQLGVILCARRDLDVQTEQGREKLMKKIDTAIAWKLGPYSKLIKGFDFVSEEDRGKPSYAYYKDIFYGEAFDGYTDKTNRKVFSDLKQQLHIGQVPRVKLIELMLHAGESLWMEQENIVNAKIASKNRMGHGFQLLAYPGALRGYEYALSNSMMRGPVLEVCPISNQMLRYFPDIRDHYALMLMKMGIPCVLSNDDPQILGNPGLSYDFWEMYMASDGGLMMIKGLVFTAYIFQYQARFDIPLSKWDDTVYADCLKRFKDLYWMPYLEEIRRITGIRPKEVKDENNQQDDQQV